MVVKMKINDKISEIVYKKTHKKTIPFEFTIKTSDIYKRIIESLKNEGFLGRIAGKGGEGCLRLCFTNEN